MWASRLVMLGCMREIVPSSQDCRPATLASKQAMSESTIPPSVVMSTQAMWVRSVAIAVSRQVM